MSDNALEVKDIYKKFRIYHEKRNSIFESISGGLSKKKYYEDLDVLKGVSFNIKKGEMLGIIGPNGSGKTTLLRIISRVYQADRGQVKVYGNLIPFLSLGLGFQNLLTAKSNIIQYGRSEISSDFPFNPVLYCWLCALCSVSWYYYWFVSCYSDYDSWCFFWFQERCNWRISWIFKYFIL